MPPLRPGLQPRIGRRLAYAVALSNGAAEVDAMNEFDTFSSYTAVEPINEEASLPDLYSLLCIFKRMRGCEGADGLP